MAVLRGDRAMGGQLQRRNPPEVGAAIEQRNRPAASGSEQRGGTSKRSTPVRNQVKKRDEILWRRKMEFSDLDLEDRWRILGKVVQIWGLGFGREEGLS